MSGFDLVPVDGGVPVHLPPGDTVQLGRGPTLGVSDRRVSRNHGLLENTGGHLRLKPTHVNPCFIQSSLSEEPRPLTKGSWYPLRDGDLVSLLPGQFVFRVVAGNGKPSTPSQIFEEQQDGEEEEEHPGWPGDEPTCPSSAERGQNSPLDRSSRSLNKEVEDEDGGANSSRTRSRVLPAWMMAAAPPTSSSRVQSNVRERKLSSSLPAAAEQATPTTAFTHQGEELDEEEERPRKKRRKIQDGPAVEPSVLQEQRGGASPDVSESEEDRKTKDLSDSAPSKPGLRRPCPYGLGCYRKNPLHFQEFSHPGDSDHHEEQEEEEEEEEEDRPECPYGTDCYRKNPLHRKEFKHTRRAVRATRSAPRRSPAHNDEDDSFINDDSEDAGDDSDYVPPDSDS